MATRIEWCDETWNPVRTRDGGYHCTKVSPGCDHCWAETFNNRFGNHRPYDGSTPDYVVNETCLHQVFHWTRQRRIFAQSMGDLGLIGMYAPSVLSRVMSVISQSIAYSRDPRFAHRFILLTKRPEELFRVIQAHVPDFMRKEMGPCLEIGVTVEDQARVDERIPKLFLFRDLFPGCKLFISAEPLLGEIDIRPFLRHHWQCSGCGYRTNDRIGNCKGYCQDPTGKSCDAVPCPGCGRLHYWCGSMESLDGVILGGETGPKARPMDPEWVRRVRNDCIRAKTPFFFKSWGKAIPSITDSFGDANAMAAPKIDLFLRDFRRFLDGRTWDQLPGRRT